MQILKPATFRRRQPRLLIAALTAVSGTAAWADEPSPWYFGASQSLTHESNAYRTTDAQADTYSNTGLSGGFDQPISRQRIYAAANVNYNKYREQSTLDNTAYGVNAGWDWATIETLSGSLNASANRSLAALGNFTTVPLTTRNLIKTDQVSTNVRWGGAGPLSLSAAYAHSRVRYSAPEALSSTSSGDSASVNATYRLGSQLQVGGGVRFSRTESPYAVPLVVDPAGPGDYAPNTGKGRNLDLTLNWTASAQTGVNARVSWTRQSNSDNGDSDFSGLTGSIAGTYSPTAKIGLSLSASRDAGSNASFFNYFIPATPATPTAPANSGTTVLALSETSRTTNSLTFGANYAATAKISLRATAQLSRAKLVDTVPATTTQRERTDSSRLGSLGVSYAIARAWDLGCNVSHSTRELSGDEGFSYSNNSVNCSAQFTLR